VITHSDKDSLDLINIYGAELAYEANEIVITDPQGEGSFSFDNSNDRVRLAASLLKGTLYAVTSYETLKDAHNAFGLVEAVRAAGFVPKEKPEQLDSDDENVSEHTELTNHLSSWAPGNLQHHLVHDHGVSPSKVPYNGPLNDLHAKAHAGKYGESVTVDLDQVDPEEHGTKTTLADLGFSNWAEVLADFLNRKHGKDGFGYSADKPGKKYTRVIKGPPGYSSAHAFVDAEGNVYKNAGWAGPAKGIRATVHDILDGKVQTDPHGGYLYS
jgi:hypothetical protein